MTPLDRGWMDAHPLPLPQGETDKNARGRILIVGGSGTVPGALLLTGEAAYRAGAGKVQLAVPQAGALAVGVRFPEAAVFGLPTNAQGELGPEPETLVKLAGSCDALLLGPGMGPAADATALLRGVVAGDAGFGLVLDAAMIPAARGLEESILGWRGPKILTPHRGEMAALIGCAEHETCPEMASELAGRLQAIVLLKASETWIALPDGGMLHYAGGGPGLATGGSGDVLAGVIGGLVARGITPDLAAAWGVWAHGEAGRASARQTAPIGFLARELLPALPGLLYPD